MYLEKGALYLIPWSVYLHAHVKDNAPPRQKMRCALIPRLGGVLQLMVGTSTRVGDDLLKYIIVASMFFSIIPI